MVEAAPTPPVPGFRRQTTPDLLTAPSGLNGREGTRLGSRSEGRASQPAVEVCAAAGDHSAGVIRTASEEAAKVKYHPA